VSQLYVVNAVSPSSAPKVTPVEGSVPTTGATSSTRNAETTNKSVAENPTFQTPPDDRWSSSRLRVARPSGSSRPSRAWSHPNRSRADRVGVAYSGSRRRAPSHASTGTGTSVASAAGEGSANSAYGVTDSSGSPAAYPRPTATAPASTASLPARPRVRTATASSVSVAPSANVADSDSHSSPTRAGASAPDSAAGTNASVSGRRNSAA